MIRQTHESMFVRKMVFVLIMLGVVIMVLPTILFADLENAYVLGNNLGLVINEDPGSVVSDNLAPGEIVRSTMTLENNGAGPFEVYFKTNITQGSELSPRGGNLADILLIEIKSGDKILVTQMPFREAAQLSQISIAQMAVGSKLVLDFEVYFPETASNDYQGATFQAYWTFVVVGGIPSTSENTTVPTIPTGPTEPTVPTIPAESTVPVESAIPTQNQANATLETANIVDEEDTPLGAAMTSESSESLDEIFNEEIPLDVALPKTGQLSVIYFWVTGMSLICVGVWLLRRQ